jgi:hypothetical protein
MVGMVREWYVESQHLQGCSSRLCRLRTDGLPPTSKYWTYRSHARDMGPVSLVAGCQQKLVFSSLPQWLLWERSLVWTYGLVSHRDVGWVGRPSSQGHGNYSNLLMTMWKVYVLIVWDTYGLGTYADWWWDECGVLVGFSPTLIRIAMTLGYE